MARNHGRWGRLRRVLNEDLSTSTQVHARVGADRTPGDTPRYGAGANIENHPQITDYVPRRFRVTALILAGGAALGVIAEAVARHADSIANVVGVTPEELTASLGDRLVNWTSVVLLIVAAAYMRIVFLLKRHRLDDLRGRYRVWRQAGMLAVILSASFVTSAHAVAASAVGHMLGVHPLGSDLLWWLGPTALVGGWVMLRLMLDAAECRLALASFGGAALSFAAAAACAAGWSPLVSPLASESLVRNLPLAACLFAMAGTLLTARYVVLDVQGLIEHPSVELKPAVAPPVSGVAAAATMQAAEHPTAWTDGSEPDDDYTDDDRPLSKAERKRLRKQHGRYRAA